MEKQAESENGDGSLTNEEDDSCHWTRFDHKHFFCMIQAYFFLKLWIVFLNSRIFQSCIHIVQNVEITFSSLRWYERKAQVMLIYLNLSFDLKHDMSLCSMLAVSWCELKFKAQVHISAWTWSRAFFQDHANFWADPRTLRCYTTLSSFLQIHFWFPKIDKK